MNIWIVTHYNDHYPYDVTKFHAFKTWEKCFAYLSDWYDECNPQAYREDLIDAYGFNHWEDCKKSLIESNSNDYVQWKKLELE